MPVWRDFAETIVPYVHVVEVVSFVCLEWALPVWRGELKLLPLMNATNL